jgi:hypothetical protein
MKGGWYPMSAISAGLDLSQYRREEILRDGTRILLRPIEKSDVTTMQSLLLRVSAMVEDIPEIAEMDLNPVNVMPKGKGYRVIDARIMLK